MPRTRAEIDPFSRIQAARPSPAPGSTFVRSRTVSAPDIPQFVSAKNSSSPEPSPRRGRTKPGFRSPSSFLGHFPVSWGPKPPGFLHRRRQTLSRARPHLPQPLFSSEPFSPRTFPGLFRLKTVPRPNHRPAGAVQTALARHFSGHRFRPTPDFQFVSTTNHFPPEQSPHSSQASGPQAAFRAVFPSPAPQNRPVSFTQAAGPFPTFRPHPAPPLFAPEPLPSRTSPGLFRLKTVPRPNHRPAGAAPNPVSGLQAAF